MKARQVDLLITLCTNTSFITANSLADKYHTSAKTIYKDLDALLQIVKNNNLKLVKKRHVGIKIEGSDENRRILIKSLNDYIPSKETGIQYSPDNRRISIVKQIILDGQKTTLKNLAEKWIVSKTSILNDISIINQIIETSSGKIQSVNSNILFVGTEEQRQVSLSTFMVTNINKNKTVSDQQLSEFFSTKVVNAVDNVFKIIKRKWFSDMPDYYLLAIKIIIMVQVYRLSIKEHFVKNKKEVSQWQDKTVYQVAQQILQLLSQAITFTYQNEDIEWLARNLSAYKIGNELPQNSSEWDSTIDILLKRMESIQKINFLGKTQLKNQLLYHIPAMVLRLRQGMIVRNPLLKDIKSQYPALFGMTWYAMSFLEDKFNISLNDDEVSFITIYFHIALNKESPVNNVLIVFQKHSQLHDYVKSQIQQLLPANTRFTTVTVDELKNTDFQYINLIIAVDVVGIISDVPVVHVSSLLDSKDQANILTSYASNVILLQDSENNLNFSILKKIISPKLIFWKDSIDDKNAALDFMIKRLEDNHVVKSTFRNSIYRRERLGSTEIEGGAALPHAAPETIKQLAVAMLILKKPVWWNTESVNIIILACVPNSQIDIYRGLVMDIYKLVRNKIMVQMITDFQSTDSLIKLIKN